MSSPPSPAVTHHHLSSPAVFGCFPPSSAVLRLKLSHIVGLVILHNDGRPASSRTRADCLVPSRLVGGSWQSPRRPYRGPGRLRTLAPLRMVFLLLRFQRYLTLLICPPLLSAYYPASMWLLKSLPGLPKRFVILVLLL